MASMQGLSCHMPGLGGGSFLNSRGNCHSPIHYSCILYDSKATWVDTAKFFCLLRVVSASSFNYTFISCDLMLLFGKREFLRPFLSTGCRMTQAESHSEGITPFFSTYAYLS